MSNPDAIRLNIIMPERLDLTPYFDAFVESSTFVRWGDDSDRTSHAGVPVGHYKFYYLSQVDPQHPLEPIQLDILFAQANYPRLVDKAIQHPWISIIEPLTFVRLPDTDCLLGDKLTAFAPTTTGILYTKKRPAEIIKQLFDVGHLFDVATDLAIIGQAFTRTAQEEIAYRQLGIGPANVLADVVETALLIARRDNKDGRFLQLQEGIRRFTNFAIGGFSLEGAILAGAKAAYLSRKLREGTLTYRRYEQAGSITDWQIIDPAFNRLNKLRKSQPEAFFYWYLALV